MSDIADLQERLRQFAADRGWEQYHTPKNLAMALAGEAGELLAEFQWLTPDEATGVMRMPAKADAVRDELADVMIYLARLADVLGVDLAGVAHAKVDHNDGRFPVASAVDGRRIVVEGSPSAAENGDHERRWRQAVAQAAAGHPPCERVAIAITLEPHRTRIDIDNLARVVLAGLRDAGVCVPGFRGLDEVLVSKGVGEPGAVVTLDSTFGPLPSAPILSVTADAVPGSRDLDMSAWEQVVAEGVTSRVVGPAWVDIAVRSERSLEAVMKPVIDGLSPFLGRDPRAHLPFTPNDHLVERLTVRRTTTGRILSVTAGPLA